MHYAREGGWSDVIPHKTTLVADKNMTRTIRVLGPRADTVTPHIRPAGISKQDDGIGTKDCLNFGETSIVWSFDKKERG